MPEVQRTPPIAFAHSVEGQPIDVWERLADHLLAVAARAGAFAAPFGWGEVARVAGLLHDVGKLSPAFQDYIRGLRPTGDDHSSAGAKLALERYGPRLGQLIAAIVAGHHAGLADGTALGERLANPALRVPPGWDGVTGTLPALATLQPTVGMTRGGPAGFGSSFLYRMLFSCLVDADFLETERFLAGARGWTVGRGGHASMSGLRDRLAAFMAAKRAGAEATPLNALRAEILDHAVGKAARPPGLFTLTVPTGGGKTLASLSFALEHAVRHGLDRVIYVIPFTGAWIETRPRRSGPHGSRVAPSRGRGSRAPRPIGVLPALEVGRPFAGRGST